MSLALRVSLAGVPHPAPPRAAERVLDQEGPAVCLGGALGGDGLAIPVVPSARSLFGPRGACLLADDGPLWIADTGHHRLLGWARMPRHDHAPADWVIGQSDFAHEGRNGKRSADAASLNVPTGITPCGAGLAVADAWNHRVLIWLRAPRSHNVAADVVLGQSDFCGVEGNRGRATASADSLFWPYGVHWDGTRLWVSDTGNRRVLMWHGVPARSGTPADRVLGQRDFVARDENGGANPNASSMRWPHAIAFAHGQLLVADAGNNRIMIWRALPESNNAPCDVVLGQSGFDKVEHNQMRYWPDAASLNMPYGLAAAGASLVVADTANSRLLAWSLPALECGAAAHALTGQVDVNSKGDNRWSMPARDSLCWPYAVSVCGNHAVVADSGNNRVALWRLAPELRS